MLVGLLPEACSAWEGERLVSGVVGSSGPVRSLRRGSFRQVEAHCCQQAPSLLVGGELLRVPVAYLARGMAAAVVTRLEQRKHGGKVEWEQVVALFGLVAGHVGGVAKWQEIGSRSRKPGCLLRCVLLGFLITSLELFL